MSEDWDFIEPDASLKVTPIRRAKKGEEPTRDESAHLLFARQCDMHALPKPLREYKFAEKLNRGWMFDFAWIIRSPVSLKLAVEIEGIVMRRTRSGEWVMGGRHATIKGYKEDAVKYATAALLDWRLMRFEQSQVKSGFAINMVMRKLARHGWRPEA